VEERYPKYGITETGEANAPDETELKGQLRKRLGAGTEIHVQLTGDLPLTARGKDRFIVSEVDLNQISGVKLNSHE